MTLYKLAIFSRRLTGWPEWTLGEKVRLAREAGLGPPNATVSVEREMEDAAWAVFGRVVGVLVFAAVTFEWLYWLSERHLLWLRIVIR
jgi:hypothetical protein